MSTDWRGLVARPAARPPARPSLACPASQPCRWTHLQHRPQPRSCSVPLSRTVSPQTEHNQPNPVPPAGHPSRCRRAPPSAHCTRRGRPAWRRTRTSPAWDTAPAAPTRTSPTRQAKCWWQERLRRSCDQHRNETSKRRGSGARPSPTCAHCPAQPHPAGPRPPQQRPKLCVNLPEPTLPPHPPQEAGELAAAVGSAMAHCGLGPHARCSVFGANSPEWMLTMQVCAV